MAERSSQDATSSPAPAEVLASRRRRRIAIGVVAVIGIAALAVAVPAVWSRVDDDHVADCGDVGVTGPVANTPADALTGWLDTPEAGGQPEIDAWREATTDDDAVTFRNREARRQAYYPEDGYHRVFVTRTPDGWAVDGACV